MLSRSIRPTLARGLQVRWCNGQVTRRPHRIGPTAVPTTGMDPPAYEIQARHPNWPDRVKIVEVGPRDGLQNENKFVTTENKLEFIKGLVGCGLRHIEATSFVSHTAVPQLMDAEGVMQGLPDITGVTYPVLVPNRKQFLKALESGAKEIAIFTSTSTEFVRANMKQDLSAVNSAYKDLVEEAKAKKIPVRGYLSCVITCPYSGLANPETVARMAESLISWGCYEVSLGDTTGAGTPGSFRSLLYHVLQRVPADKVALHCHNTYGQALANILAGLEMGITTFDSSTAGLGGCPFAPGSTGNVATEDIVFMMEGMKIETGVDLIKLVKLARHFCRNVLLKKGSRSNVTEAFPLDVAYSN